MTIPEVINIALPAPKEPFCLSRRQWITFMFGHPTNCAQHSLDDCRENKCGYYTFREPNEGNYPLTTSNIKFKD
jgi:hypothetical protein